MTATSCTATYATGQNIDLKYNWNLGADNGDLIGTTNDINPARNTAYSYDQVNRFLQGGTYPVPPKCAAPCWEVTAGLDPWGNLYSQEAGGSAAPPGGYMIFQSNVATNNHFTTAPFTYDASGNLTADATVTYVWNAESEIKTGGGVNYLYDGRGNRVEKGGSKIYWYGPGGEVLDETDSTGSTSNAAFSEYIYFAGDRIARRDYQNNVFYYFEDQVHSSRVIAEIPNGGSPTLCYDADFYPYGGEDDFTDTCSQNYKFQGKERDAETGNDYFGARFYSSTYGRFLSPDWSSTPEPVPYANLTNPQTLNLYSIVSDNPESFADLDGHTDPDPPTCTGGNSCNTPPPPPAATTSATTNANSAAANSANSPNRNNGNASERTQASDANATARATESGEAALNFTLAGVKLGQALATGSTAETGVGALATAYLAVSAAGSFVAGTVQTIGAASGQTELTETAAEAVSTVTTVLGFFTLVGTGGNLNKAATAAAAEGIVTSNPKDLMSGGTVARTAKAIDFIQNVQRVWQAAKGYLPPML